MFLLLALIQASSATYVISVYGDVYKDSDFFTTTYPWLMDNIGGEVTVDYYLQGSGRYTVPQMCALNEMRMNPFLQAQYLKCEAEGRGESDSERCLCASGIDPQKYKHCVLTKGIFASLSASKYSQLDIDARPVIEIGPKNTIFGVEDTWYLKKICTIFGDNQPRGCTKPFDCDASEALPDKTSVVQFECSTRGPSDVRIAVAYERNCYPDTKTTDEAAATTAAMSF